MAEKLSVNPLLICDWLKVSKPLPNIGSQLRSTFFLIKDAQEPKIQKLLLWTDFGPFKCLEDKNLQSIVKSLSAIEARILSSAYKHPNFKMNTTFYKISASIHRKA